ncbi:HAD family hydrolase [Vineibacter terrae]|uniref:HAD family hydrolase n=1 Tax=Vineibacter terrae TaxID=2586908 RepID=UPI002E369806|nr:HAD family hydrolase [Vineibacter terrae]HEX2887519.1 HAD family hydrolase [Vineibacter terrae]
MAINITSLPCASYAMPALASWPKPRYTGRIMPALPTAILFDLDDTIIQAYAKPEEAWWRLLERFKGELPDDTDRFARTHRAILEEGRLFWSDPVKAARWRLDLAGARRLVVRRALARLQLADDALADRIGDAFTELRRQEYKLFPDAHDTLDRLRAAGIKLALVTNGAALTQRAKVVRFDLEHRFEHIQIEGEFGKGKPDPDVYIHVLGRLGVPPQACWMIGDNVEWEVVMPQRLGMRGIWYDPHGTGLPADSTVRPDRILTRLGELLE